MVEMKSAEGKAQNVDLPIEIKGNKRENKKMEQRGIREYL